MPRLIFLATALAAAAAEPGGGAASEVTLQSLLAEMIDFDAVARWPAPAYTCRQASSYDRAKVAPDKPGWFANGDHSKFIRVETARGRREHVMMDAEGPGCVVRFWLTTNERKKGALRVYLDGAEAPAVEFPTFDLLAGDLRVGAPLATAHPGYTPGGGGGNTLYFPIPYARRCTITWEDADPGKVGPRYYQINYRTWPAGTRVRTFSMADLEQARPQVDRVNKALADPPVFAGGRLVTLERAIEPGREAEIDLPPGPAAVRRLEMKLTSDPSEELGPALRATVLRMSFDGEETAWCPVSDFSGSGVGINALRSWYRDVAPDGAMTCRWVMPYRRSGRLALSNLGKQAVKVRLSARVGEWAWDDRSMHFHANWRQQFEIPTKPFSDWNYIAIAGRGVYVGDGLALFNPLPSWYGEGDEKIWVDGESFPSHVGTGTEDYYNFSWAPKPVFQTPFANEVRLDQPATQGYNVVTRTRNLDGIPFGKSLAFDIEIIPWKETRLTYAAVTYWYGAPGATCNRAPMPEEAVRPLPAPPGRRIQGAVECEKMEVTARSGGTVVESQDIAAIAAGLWGDGRVLLVRGAKAGDFVELRFPAPVKGPRKLVLYAAKSFDYGILRFTVNGRPAVKEFDGYSAEIVPGGPFDLGVFEPKDGVCTLRAEAAGSNPASRPPRYYFGLDCVVIEEP
jgi:hypothetical protein